MTVPVSCLPASEQWFGCYDTPRSSLFTRESNRHPAKMAVGLCFRILEHGEKMGYWKPGDTILDPMCGIGTTLVCAGMKGYHFIGVELEQHFWELCLQNLHHASGKLNLAIGRVYRGDARRLPELLIGSERAGGNSALPPTFDAPSGGGINVKGYGPSGADKVGERTYSNRTVSGAVASPPYGGPVAHWSGDDPHPERTHSPIPNPSYSHGDGPGTMFRGYDAAVSSPPYTDAQITGSGHFRSSREPNAADAASNPREGYSGRPGEGRVPVLNGVVSSPPYGDLSLSDGSGVSHQVRKVIREQGMDAAVKWYRENVMDRLPKHGRWSDENIRTHLENAISQEERRYGAVASPPYPSAFREEHPGTAGGAISHEAARGGNFRGYGTPEAQHTPAQIGNLRDPAGDIDAVLASRTSTAPLPGAPLPPVSYCSAMLQVYRGMWTCLRDSGVVALVTKNPVKNRKLRRLDLDTIRLMEAAGFELLERKYAMLAEEKFPLFPGLAKRERKSFFKRLYEKRGGIVVDHEDVLFFRRCSGRPGARADEKALQSNAAPNGPHRCSN